MGYRITIHDDQGDDRGCHIKVGWALEGASSGCELVSDCDFVQLGHIQLHKDDSQDAYVPGYCVPRRSSSLCANVSQGPMIAAENVSMRGACMTITSSAWQRRRR